MTAVLHAEHAGMTATKDIKNHVEVRVWKEVSIEIEIEPDEAEVVFRRRHQLSGEETIVILDHHLRRGDGGIVRLLSTCTIIM